MRNLKTESNLSNQVSKIEERHFRSHVKLRRTCLTNIQDKDQSSVEAGFNTATSRQERKPLQRKSRTTIVSYRGARDVQNTERKLPEKVDTEIGTRQEDRRKFGTIPRRIKTLHLLQISRNRKQE